MKSLKILSIILLSLVACCSCEDDSGVYVEQLHTNAQKNQAIAACLKSSADSALAHLCVPNGYYSYLNNAYRLDFQTLQNSLFDTLAQHGYGYLNDSIVLYTNRLAESCGGDFSNVLKNAISELDIISPDLLFYGEDGAITDYFKLHEYDFLRNGLRSPVSIRMDLFNVSATWNEMLNRYRAYTQEPLNFDVQNYIVTKMLDGLFEEMRIEEALIRNDSTHRTPEDSILGR